MEPIRYIEATDNKGQRRYVPEGSIEDGLGRYGWAPVPGSPVKTMVFDRTGRGYFFVPEGQEANFDSEKFGVAGVDKFDVPYTTANATKERKQDISVAPLLSAQGWTVVGSPQVSAEVFGESSDPGQDADVQSAIESAQDWSYEEDPMVEEAMKTGAMYRENQSAALQRLARLTLGSDTQAEQQAVGAQASLASGLAGIANDPRIRSAAMAYQRASGDIAGRSARDVVAERAGQVQSLQAGIGSTIESSRNASDLARARAAQRYQAWLQNEQRIRDLKGLASDLNQARAAGSISNAQVQDAVDAAMLQPISSPDYSQQIMAAGAGAVGAGLSIGADLYEKYRKPRIGIVTGGPSITPAPAASAPGDYSGAVDAWRQQFGTGNRVA